MPTEYVVDLFGFARVEGRRAEASFAGESIASGLKQAVRLRTALEIAIMNISHDAIIQIAAPVMHKGDIDPIPFGITISLPQ